MTASESKEFDYFACWGVQLKALSLKADWKNK